MTNENKTADQKQLALYQNRSIYSFISIHKQWIQSYGLIGGAILTCYLDRHRFLMNSKLEYKGWFDFKIGELSELLGLTEHIVRKNKKQLIDMEVIDIKRAGHPSVELIKLDFRAIYKYEKSTALSKTIPLALSNTIELSDDTSNYNKKRKKNLLRKKKKSSPQILVNISSKDFDLFYRSYPNKGQKGKAFTEWGKLIKLPLNKRPLLETILTAIKNQKTTDRWQDPKFIPLASTWLKESRWMDDVNEMGITKNTPMIRGRKITTTKYRTDGEI